MPLTPPEPLQPAQFELRADGSLYSTQYDDVFASSAGALAQAQHVFLAGNGLPARWREADSFVVLETGFGTGLNFLGAYLYGISGVVIAGVIFSVSYFVWMLLLVNSTSVPVIAREASA